MMYSEDVHVIRLYLSEGEGKERLHPIVFFGDQLTAERRRKCQEYKVSDEGSEQALLGLVPAISDWHAEVNYLEVSALV